MAKLQFVKVATSFFKVRKMKDYYNILGVEKNATTDDIKAAYKKLALKYHPDRWSTKSKEEQKQAEEKFKEITEAYSVLSDEEKRKQYDNPQSDSDDFFKQGFDFGDDFGINPNDFFSMHSGNRINKGESLNIAITLTLEELYNGTSKPITYDRLVRCDRCRGKGVTEKSKIENCPHCHGRGYTETTNGPWRVRTGCQYCGGSGKIVKDPCDKCGGIGLAMEKKTVTVDIPKGAISGFTLKMSGLGNETKNPNGYNGDLYIHIQEERNGKFEREGNDLYFNLKINITDALLGCTKEVDTIDGKKLSVKLKSGLESGMHIKFDGMGMPIYGSNNQRGDMYGIIDVTIPKELNSDEKKLIEKLSKMPHFKS